jgi:ribonuclease Z
VYGFLDGETAVACKLTAGERPSHPDARTGYNQRDNRMSRQVPRTAVAFLALAVALAVVTIARAQPSTAEMVVTLLGTGSVPPVLDKFGPASLVEAGGDKILIDAGRGVLQRLNQVGARNVSKVFLTHLHSDHVVGLPDLYLIGWFSRGKAHLQVWGPEGTSNMTGHLREAFVFDRKMRVEDDGSSPEGAMIDAHDISEGVAYDVDGLKVTAFFVDHAPVKPALGFRVDYRGRSAVFSGDTRFNENLIAHAKGADLLIHEVSASRDPTQTQTNNRVLAHHTTPEQAGTVFSRVRPKLAVYSHVGTGGDPNGLGLSDDDLIGRTRSTYDGALAVGYDLMRIRVAEQVTIGDRP